MTENNPKIAVLLPCYNEQGAIGPTVKGFKKALPTATIHVFDNQSTDKTALEAMEAGAFVHHEKLRGKGHVVRRMFAEIDADCYIMADGDGTYEAEAAPKLVAELLDNRLDMVVGTRIPVEDEDTYRPGHKFGNKLLTSLVHFFFGRGFTDILSGYRAFSRRFAKSFPAHSKGFEIETEITIHALSLSMPTSEVETQYFERTGGTTSKLNTFRDGWRILMTIMRLFKDYRPLIFFAATTILLASSSILLAIPIITEFMKTGLVPRFPTAILSTGLMLSALLSMACGFILDSVAWHRLESKRMRYLDIDFWNKD